MDKPKVVKFPSNDIITLLKDAKAKYLKKTPNVSGVYDYEIIAEALKHYISS